MFLFGSLIAPAFAYNFQSCPPLYKLAPANASMMAQYDFSKILDSPNAVYSNSYNPPACVSMSSPNCPFVCNCTRPTDIQLCEDSVSWGLTFDDGPSPSTPILLDYLKANELTATFFVVGSQAARYPDTVLRAYNEGHHIAIHTWSHPALTTVATANIVAEIQYTINIIHDIIGVKPLYIRTPYGDIDDRVRSIISAMGLKNVLWAMDTGDFHLFNNPNAITEASFIKQVATFEANRPSGIVDLGHDLVNATANFATNIRIKTIRNTGKKIMSVAKCKGDSEPYSGKSQGSSSGQSQNQVVGSTPQLAHSSSLGLNDPFIFILVTSINAILF